MKLTNLNELIEGNEILNGHWEFGDNHELIYRVRGPNQEAEEIRFKGTLVAAEPGTLVISAIEEKERGEFTAGLLRLTGTWQVDPKNRIVFDVEKDCGRKDRLVFGARWKVGPSHEIIYAYECQCLKTKTEEIREFVIRGIWDISENDCLIYSIGGDSNSALKFRGTFQTKSILAKKGEIRYQIGTEIESRPETREITLFGKWKVSRDFELFFEMEYASGKKQAIAFGGTFTPAKGASVSVALKTRGGELLGVELVLTREIFEGEGAFFLRLRKSVEESAIEIGVKIPW